MMCMEKVSNYLTLEYRRVCNGVLYIDIYAFVVLKDGVVDPDTEVAEDLRQLVRKHIGGFAVPQAILV